MKQENLFEYATKAKLRFPYKGTVTVEDLWDLSLTALDSIFKTLNSLRKAEKEESLLEDKGGEDTKLEAQIEIIKYIVGIKLAERDATNKALANKAKKEKLLSILARKQDEELEGKSIEELTKMIDSL